MKYIAAVVFCISALSGCQSVQHQTASGRPEASIAAPADQVKTAFVGSMTNYGYQLTRDSQFQIVMERQSDNAMANVLLGSNYDPTVEARVTATFLDMGAQTRVTADMGIVRNGGSAFEAVTPMNNNVDSLGVQNLLDEIKTGLESRKSVGQVVSEASTRTIGARAQAVKATQSPQS
ncbi:hypothetical protein Sa4125_24850 [Aureimonas sp. SA4125]|uniref:hypothetical protein n=1 Tax=Aureimonas sp. SA4125 TaxID=2826993 RepID=UPI001CC6DD3D|nr:hypothetical protein [Aureimonas sp. SA4125]BDA84943.1 hypothetical protein Sa4125_24850 [Aureimonas sp. SA4125]